MSPLLEPVVGRHPDDAVGVVKRWIILAILPAAFEAFANGRRVSRRGERRKPVEGLIRSNHPILATLFR